MPWGAIIPAAISVIGGVVNTLATNRANRKAVEEQNEYNTPVNQMQRLSEAGLNSNLMYQQGNTGNQSSPREVTDFDRAASALTSIGPLLLQEKQLANDTSRLQLQQQQFEETKRRNAEQFNLWRSNARYNDFRSKFQDLQNNFFDKTQSYQARLLEQRWANLALKNLHLGLDTEELIYNKNLFKYQNDKKLFEAEADDLALRWKFNKDTYDHRKGYEKYKYQERKSEHEFNKWLREQTQSLGYDPLNPPTLKQTGSKIINKASSRLGEQLEKWGVSDEWNFFK